MGEMTDDSAYAHGDVIQLELNQSDTAEYLSASPGNKIKATDISKRAHRKLLLAGVKVKYSVEHRLRRGR